MNINLSNVNLGGPKKSLNTGECNINVLDNLMSNSKTDGLSANQGRLLNINKQNNLTAGKNITITNDVISASNVDLPDNLVYISEEVNTKSQESQRSSKTEKKIILKDGGGDICYPRTTGDAININGKLLPDKLDEMEIKVVETADTTLILKDCTQFNYEVNPTELTLALPQGWTSEDLTIITFNTGDTAPQITIPSTLKVKGAVEPNKAVEISIYNNTLIMLNI